MRLKDLLPYVYDNVCIYNNSANSEYETIYKGRPVNVPNSLLEAEVRVIGAKKDNLVDIGIKMSE